MPAQVRSVATSNSGTAASTTMAATMPAGVVAGDLLISVAFSALAAAPSARTGGTLIRNVADTASNMDVVRRTAAGGDAISWTVTSRKWSTVTVAIVAGTWDTVTPFDVENGINHTAATATLYTSPAVVTTATGMLLLAVFGNAAASTWSVPAQTPPMTLGGQATSTGTAPASISLTHSALNAVPAGSISRQATASVTSAEACMWIGAVRPSATPTEVGFDAVQGQRFNRRATIRAATW